MKKIKFVLPGLGNRVFTLGVPGFSSIKEIRKSTVLLNIVNVVAFVLFNLFLLLLPFSEQTYVQTGETATFRYLFVMLVVNFFFFLTAVILNGKKRLIDPPGFIYILVFNLLIAFAGVISTSTKVSNTFGATNFRSLAGLTLMCLIGFYYLINVYSSNSLRLKRTINILEWGYILYTAVLLMQSINDPASFKKNILMVLLGFGFMWLKVLKLNKDRMFFSLAALIVSLLIFISFNFQQGDYETIAEISLFAFVSILPVYLLILLKRKNNIRLNLKYILQRLKTLAEERKIIGTFHHENAMKRIYFIVSLLLPVIFFGIFIFAILQNTNLFKDFGTALTTYVDNFKGLTSISNIKSIIFGQGSDYYSLTTPLLSNILMMHGLVGFVGYVLIWLYGIFKSRNVLLLTIKNKESVKTVTALMFIMFFVPIYNVFSISGLNLIILWWVAFSLLCAYEFKGNVSLFDNKVNPIYLVGKRYPRIGIALKFVLVLLLGIIAAFGLTFILGIVK